MNTRRVSLLGVLVALALALHVIEAQIPSPLPWVRPGLANLVLQRFSAHLRNLA